MSKLLFQGHGSYRITTDDGVIIYVDPFIGSGYDVPADIILVTHEHADHNKVDIVKKKSDTVIIRNNTLRLGNIYNATSIKGVGIEAVEAYNKNHSRYQCVGFVLRFSGLTIYASGDTSTTDDMKNKLPNYDIDYALLPIDGKYNMDVEEAMNCAKLIKAKKVIPIHMKPMELFDEEMASKFDIPNRCVVRPGEEIDL